MTAIQCISRDGCIDPGYCQYCGRCLRPAVVTYSEPRCPHGYVISDTTHQCPKCGPVEVVSSKTVSLPPMDSDEADPILRTMETVIKRGSVYTPLLTAQYLYEALLTFMPAQVETPAPHQVQCMGCDMGLPLSGAEHLGPNTGEPVGICERVRAAQKTSTEPGS